MRPPASAVAPIAALTRLVVRHTSVAALWALTLGLLGVGAGVAAAALPLALDVAAEARETSGETGAEDDAAGGGVAWRGRSALVAAGDGTPPAYAPGPSLDTASAVIAPGAPAVSAPTASALRGSIDAHRARRARRLPVAGRPRPPTTHR